MNWKTINPASLALGLSLAGLGAGVAGCATVNAAKAPKAKSADQKSDEKGAEKKCGAKGADKKCGADKDKKKDGAKGGTQSCGANGCG
jgi:hypothetical protein